MGGIEIEEEAISFGSSFADEFCRFGGIILYLYTYIIEHLEISY